MTENIVILGSSIVSVFTTSELRKDGYEAKITIVASENRFPYDKPPLSKEWMQDNKDEKLPLLKPETFFDDNNIQLILNTKITSIDTDKKQLFSEDDQTISYDKLVINFKKCFKRRLNMTFYDENGNVIAYTEDSVHLYLFNGKPVVYFANKKVYGFNGSHLGWFEDGWIRDLKGKCVLFNSTATDGPIKSIKQSVPVKDTKESTPVKKSKKRVKIKNINHSSWSHIRGKDFLLQGI